MVQSNCAVEAVSVYPTYQRPFDMIFELAKTEEWWALFDDLKIGICKLNGPALV